jgi:hypothetical protein
MHNNKKNVSMKTITITTENQSVEINLEEDSCFDEMMQSFVGALISMGYQYGNFESYICEQHKNIKEWQ